MVNISAVNKDERRAISRHITDACVRAANAKGWKDAVGVLHGTLFLACEPMSLDELAEETGYSKTTVRLNMNLLSDLGVVRRVLAPKERRFLYILETNSVSMRSAIMSNMKTEMKNMLAALDSTEKDIDLCSASHDAADRERARRRIYEIRRFYEQVNRLLDLLNGYSTADLIALLENANW
jgi:HTH-type transcriptional regulator, glycine betaine synthesis regulator